MKVLIIGGVAGGASAAARLRRVTEEAEIIMFERGEHISFANCGLPYYIGGTIKERQNLLVQTVEGMEGRFGIDVRVKSEITKIDRENKKVHVKNWGTNEQYEESYDYLILSPGAKPIKFPIPGIDSEHIFSLRSLEDTDNITDFIETEKPKKAVVVGGGFIGLEMVENLIDRGLDTSLVEALDQVMPPLDYEMAAIVQKHLKDKGAKLYLSDKAISFENQKVTLDSKKELDADLVILSIGVAPESDLAKEAGLDLGQRGTIKVNKYLQTSDPSIYAVGDVIEVEDLVNKAPTFIPLAGPANRQGRIAANNVGGQREVYHGSQGTSIAKVFDYTVAATGNSEKVLKKLGIKYCTSYTNSASHAGYFPGAIPMTVKTICDLKGKVLGAQIVGQKGVDKRIDVFATAIKAKMNVEDLEQLELAYAPPYSTAKDPVNVAGFVANNTLKGDMDIIHWHEIDSILGSERYSFVDVRTKEEFDNGHIENSVHIPIDEFRDNWQQIPKDKEIILICQTGLRSYLAGRLLAQKGYSDVKNLSGGYYIYHMATTEKKELSS
ncbi:FAD-dependent oxidoreductase [Proteinivorax hydrogeniformans]|uniref:FAD-dependent oxidoreductase n=1 Tax=Proteinivorax hydrogeniformans TaxID=1826727 RepID=A0AAU8HRI2_9FIRM